MSEQQPSFKESLNNSLEVIAEEPVLRAILNGIPSVGGSLNELLAGKGQRMIEERRDNLLRLLAEHMEAIEADAIKNDYFQTPEGFDLLIKAFDSSRRTRSEEKRDLIARILAGAATEGSEEYSPEEYLNLVSDLTPQELMVLGSAHRRRSGTGRDFRAWSVSVRTEVNLDRNDLFMTLARLEAHGLIQMVEKAAQQRRSGGQVTLRDHIGLDRIERISVSPPFEKLMGFLDPNA